MAANDSTVPAVGTGAHSGELGLMACTALVAGNMIGSGVFLLPASLAAYGPISTLGWVVTSVGAMMLAIVFARLARTVPGSGGPYTYSRAGFSEFAGFLVGWGYWITRGPATRGSQWRSRVTSATSSPSGRSMPCSASASPSPRSGCSRS